MAETRNYDEDLLRQYEHWSVFLHENQYFLGRSYIALNRTGDIDPFVETTDDERTELRDVVCALTKCINELYRPDKFNYANLRNMWEHCHWHVIPRYQHRRHINGVVFEDQNWGRNYAPYDRDLVIPENVFNTIKGDMRATIT